MTSTTPSYNSWVSRPAPWDVRAAAKERQRQRAILTKLEFADDLSTDEQAEAYALISSLPKETFTYAFGMAPEYTGWYPQGARWAVAHVKKPLHGPPDGGTPRWITVELFFQDPLKRQIGRQYGSAHCYENLAESLWHWQGMVEIKRYPTGEVIRTPLHMFGRHVYRIDLLPTGARDPSRSPSPPTPHPDDAPENSFPSLDY